MDTYVECVIATRPKKKRPKGNRKELTVTVAAWHGGEFHLATIGGDGQVRWQPYIYNHNSQSQHRSGKTKEYLSQHRHKKHKYW